jgi:hypothetical protein
MPEGSVVNRPRRGDRFVSRHLLRPGARPPYGPDSYAVQVVTAVRGHGQAFTVYYTSANRWDAGDRNGTWYADSNKINETVREWLAPSSAPVKPQINRRRP